MLEQFLWRKDEKHDSNYKEMCFVINISLSCSYLKMNLECLCPFAQCFWSFFCFCFCFNKTKCLQSIFLCSLQPELIEIRVWHQGMSDQLGILNDRSGKKFVCIVWPSLQDDECAPLLSVFTDTLFQIKLIFFLLKKKVNL
jgi:hypothetical protein